MARAASSSFFSENLRAGKLTEHLFDALGFLADHQRFLQLLQVDRRIVVHINLAKLVAGENVREQVAFVETIHPFAQQSFARLGRRFAWPAFGAAQRRRGGEYFQDH